MVYINLAFLDISGGELLVILLAAFFVFGPKRLPEIARKIGRTMNEIKSASNEITREFASETKAISSEIKAAREAIRIESLDKENTQSIKNISSNQIQINSATVNLQNNLSANKLSPQDCVTYANDNKVDINDVKGESPQNI